jgi:hypothetical protein
MKAYLAHGRRLAKRDRAVTLAEIGVPRAIGWIYPAAE